MNELPYPKHKLLWILYNVSYLYVLLFRLYAVSGPFQVFTFCHKWSRQERPEFPFPDFNASHVQYKVKLMIILAEKEYMQGNQKDVYPTHNSGNREL